MRHLISALLLGCLLVPASARAEALVEGSTGTHFEAAPTIDGIGFKCLGAGLRKKFVVKVYAAAFCVDAAKADEVTKAAAAKAGKVDEDNQAYFDAIREASAAKAIDMRFVHDVDKGKIIEAFDETLDKALGKGKDPEGRAKFLALVDRDIKNGDRVTLTSTAEGKLTLTIAGHAGSVTDPAIARTIWEAWIGRDSVTPGIKESMARSPR